MTTVDALIREFLLILERAGFGKLFIPEETLKEFRDAVGKYQDAIAELKKTPF